MGKNSSAVRIAFLTDSLEPGKSGVGDVTRHLAMELAQRGYLVQLVAINDPWSLSSQELGEIYPEGTIRIGRFSTKSRWQNRLFAIRKQLMEFQPDLISLQFVCYAYDSRGLTFFINRWIEQMLKGFSTQIMFHELWVGQNLDALLKEKLLGWLQSQSILAMLRRLQPKRVHTSNPTYVAMLRHVGVSATCLPLPSAVTISTTSDQNWFYERLAVDNVIVNEWNRSEHWIFGFFGALHLIWPPEPLLSYIRQAAQQCGKAVVFCAVGHLGRGESMWDRMAHEHSAWGKWVKFGTQSEGRISHFLRELDYGVATTPWEIIGKSSSVVTMLEHGLPVIVNRSLQFGLGTDGMKLSDPRLIRMDETLPQVLIEGRSRGILKERTPTVADQFLEDCFG